MSERTLTGVAARIDGRIPKAEDFASELRGPRTAARVGAWLGSAFVVCFLTGLFSHLLQHPLGWLPLPTGPARLYQVTQGLHVAAGTAAVPLLLVKLWAVFPRLFLRPPLEPRRLALHLLERGSVVPARRLGGVPARDRPGQLGAVVPVALRLHPLALRRRVGGRGLGPPPRRGQAAPGTGRVRGAPGGRAGHPRRPLPALAAAHHLALRRRAPCSPRRPSSSPASGASHCSPSAPAPDRRGCRSTAAPSVPSWPTGSPTRRGGCGSPARPAPSSSPATSCSRCPSARPCCPSRASRAGAPAAPGAGSPCATSSPSSAVPPATT